MAALTYPSILPSPQLAPYDPTEQRNLTDGAGPREARAFQRDRHSIQRVQFKFTPDQSAQFKVWVDNTLIFGGCWFAASWRIPPGGTSVRRLMMETQSWTFLATGHWVVSIDCEVRGVGEAPNGIETDPLWASVLFLMQGGSITDQSSYAHTTSVEVGGVTQDVPMSEFPGGLGVSISAAHNAGGIAIANGSEFNMGAAGARCYETFIYVPALSGGSLGAQILFNDGFGFNGHMVYISTNASFPLNVGALSTRINSGGEITASDFPRIVEAEPWFVTLQMYVDNTMKFWAGPVSGGIAYGDVSVSAVPRPVDNVGSGPYIGYVGGSGGLNNFTVGPYRITAAERHTADEIQIPPTLFPTSA